MEWRGRIRAIERENVRTCASSKFLDIFAFPHEKIIASLHQVPGVTDVVTDQGNFDRSAGTAQGCRRRRGTAKDTYMLAVARAGRDIAVRLAGGTGSAAAKAGSIGIVGACRRIRGVASFSSTRGEGDGHGQGYKGGWNQAWSSRIGILAGFGGACALGVLAQSFPQADCQAGMSGGAGGSPCPVRGHAKQEEGAEDHDKDFLTPDQLKALPAPGNPEGLPIYTRAQVAEHSVLGEDTPVWVIYKDGVYDITEFISGHPGGAQKIMLAAGKGIEPYWRIYQQHFNTKFALETLAGMRIGTVDPTDMLNVEEEEADPYASDPVRSDDLIYHGTKPCNAETPAWVHADNYITPNDLFYVRHHSPVPEPDMSKYRLEVEGQGIPVPASLTLEQIKALPMREVTVTIQCAGNRRSHFESVNKTQVVESSPVTADTQTTGDPHSTSLKLRSPTILLRTPYNPGSDLSRASTTRASVGTRVPLARRCLGVSTSETC